MILLNHNLHSLLRLCEHGVQVAGTSASVEKRGKPSHFGCLLYHRDMTTVRITEAELARDLHAVLEKVQQGSEVIVEREDHRPVAVIRPPQGSGRPIIEILRDATKSNSTVTLDEDFGKDLEEIIAAHQQPGNPPSWD